MTTERAPIAVSPAQAADMLGVSRWHIYRLIDTRQIQSAKSGARVLVDVESLQDYYQSIKRSS